MFRGFFAGEYLFECWVLQRLLEVEIPFFGYRGSLSSFWERLNFTMGRKSLWMVIFFRSIVFLCCVDMNG